MSRTTSPYLGVKVPPCKSSRLGRMQARYRPNLVALAFREFRLFTGYVYHYRDHQWWRERLFGGYKMEKVPKHEMRHIVIWFLQGWFNSIAIMEEAAREPGDKPVYTKPATCNATDRLMAALKKLLAAKAPPEAVARGKWPTNQE